jgi:hypothetical protein
MAMALVGGFARTNLYLHDHPMITSLDLDEQLGSP